MEQEHPIPQQISSYQFRLVGDMTLKQFFQVAGGALVSLILYASGLPMYVKWPLIVFSFLFGVALAFFPLQDRPLSVWLVSFFRSIYSPTIYRWQKTVTPRNYFQPESVPTVVTAPTAEVAESQPTSINQLEKKEAEFLSKVTEHFKSPLPVPKPKAIKPNLVANNSTVPITPAKAFVYQEAEIKPASKGENGVSIPVAQSPVVEHLVKQEPVATVQIKPTPTINPQANTYISQVTSQTSMPTTQAVFSTEANPPIPPTRPNIIVGQVTTKEGKIIENAILEIQDYEGRPVRAIKSNRLGHFMIVTPLIDGSYKIITEKDGFEFDPIAFTVKGEIIPSIAVRSK